MDTVRLFETSRFMLFTGDTYYPSGGMEDYRGSFRSRELAKAEALRQIAEGQLNKEEYWWDIFDLLEGTILKALANMPGERLVKVSDLKVV